MLRIIYTSRVRGSLSKSQLQELASAAYLNNKALGITGVLLHSKSHFLQCIEGPNKAVVDVFSKIVCDNRHFDVVLLERMATKTRLFSNRPLSLISMRDGELACAEKGLWHKSNLKVYCGVGLWAESKPHSLDFNYLLGEIANAQVVNSESS